MNENQLQQLLQAINTLQDLGKVAYFNKGAYNSETTYEINDVITYQGSSYVSLDNNNQGNLPTNTTYWSIVALKGDKGDTGKPFVIEKTYSSVEDMVADYDNMNINDYVMISGNIEEEQNATLWTKTETPAPTYKWVYLADFSGASGITGQTPNIQIGNVTEGNEPAVTRRQGSSNENPILDFVLKTGATGATGATGNGISQVSKTGTSGLTDTYTISYTNGNNTTFDVTNGKGISSIAKTGTSGLVDTYTITYNDGTTSTFTITNGEDGEVTQAQLDEVQAELDRYKTLANVLPKTTGEGTEVTLNNCGASLLKMQPKGNTEQDSYTGKNLLKYPYINTTSTIDNITFTDNGDGSITIDGRCTASSYCLWHFYESSWSYNNLTFELEAGTYTFKSIGTDIFQLSINTYKSDNTYEFFKVQDTDVTKTFAEKVRLNMRLQINAGVTVNNFIIYPMIEKGSTATDWEPFVGGSPSPSPDYPQDVRVVTGNNTIHISNSDNTISQEFLLSLGNIELCKIGDYQDYIYKDNGKWYKHSEIGKVVLDGTQTGFNSTTLTITTRFSKYLLEFGFKNITSSSTGFNNQFSIKNSFTDDDEHLYFYNDNLYFFYNKSRIADVNALYTYLANNNLIVYGQLETPTNIEITDSTLISQLNALNDTLSFDGQTNISSEYTSGNAPVIISAEAIAKFSS